MVEKRRPAGRPDATSHAAIEAAAFRLFAERGFDSTTLEAIAAEVGVGKRTLFNYFASKNDIPWGQFDKSLAAFRELFAAADPDVPLPDAIRAAVVAFNSYPDEARPSHRERMALILGTPALQAHSVLRYRQWRDVIAEFAAGRLGVSPGALAPRTIGHVSLALALSAYEAWLTDEDADIKHLLGEAMDVLADHLVVPPASPSSR